MFSLATTMFLMIEWSFHVTCTCIMKLLCFFVRKKGDSDLYEQVCKIDFKGAVEAIAMSKVNWNCTCVYMYVYVCVYLCVCACLCVCTHACCMCAWVCACMHVCMHVCVHMCMLHVCMGACVRVCMHYTFSCRCLLILIIHINTVCVCCFSLYM